MCAGTAADQQSIVLHCGWMITEPGGRSDIGRPGRGGSICGVAAPERKSLPADCAPCDTILPRPISSTARLASKVPFSPVSGATTVRVILLSPAASAPVELGLRFERHCSLFSRSPRHGSSTTIADWRMASVSGAEGIWLIRDSVYLTSGR